MTGGPAARRDWDPGAWLSVSHAWGATAWYVIATLAMSWPLLRGISRDIPADLGDSLLNAWILGWNADHLLRVLSGDWGALASYWHANIFHPEPLALAYSEHLFAPAVQILPVYALTGNLILCYNLLFLSTFVLSGLGVYLLVRDLTGSSRAAFVAGLIYAFAPYRIAQFTHLQVLSSQWMPFVLYGLRRYFVTRRALPLVGGSAALVAQNLSCGYYLLYFSPFVLAYALYEMATRRLLRDVRVWVAMTLAAAAVTMATVPFLLPYREVRILGTLERSLDEVQWYSADVYSYLTAPPRQRIWGDIAQAYPKAEGELFPSIIPVLLAGIGLLAHARCWAPNAPVRAVPRRWRWLGAAAAAAMTINAAAALLILADLGGTYRLGPLTISVRSFDRALLQALIAGGVWLALSHPCRRFVAAAVTSPLTFYAAALVVAWWLSFGPTVMSRGHPVVPGLYSLLHTHVPGYDAVRVPARFAMLVMLFMAVTAGFGAQTLERSLRYGRTIVLAIGLGFLLESTSAPIVVNTGWVEPGVQPTPSRIHTGDSVPLVYRYLSRLPGDSVIVHFPFGTPGYELIYMYYSTEHWRPIVNGYSGAFPAAYQRRVAVLRDVTQDPDRAWEELVQAGATHAIVHEAAYLPGDAGPVMDWLERHGAVRLRTVDRDHVYELPFGESEDSNEP